MDEGSDHPGETSPLNVSLKGILFDFDGTLADTMEGHYQAWKSALAEYGIALQAREYYPLEGRGLHDVAREFTRKWSWTEVAVGELVRKKKQYYVQRQSIVFFPGVESLVSDLRTRGVPMGIVTAGHLDQLQMSVPKRFLDQFDVLVTGDLIERSKPDPEPYLRGAEKLGLAPPDCVAVENSPLGIRSARNAGMYSIGVCSTVGRADLNEADEVLERFEDLRKLAVIRRFLGNDRSHARI